MSHPKALARSGNFSTRVGKRLDVRPDVGGVCPEPCLEDGKATGSTRGGGQSREVTLLQAVETTLVDAKLLEERTDDLLVDGCDASLGDGQSLEQGLYVAGCSLRTLGKVPSSLRRQV
jgi:hypothetical protein